MAYERREYPDWSWSHSRQRTFQECRRRYYYQYYASHNGWERNAPPLARLAYRLKNLTTMHMVFGDALHRVAAATLQQPAAAGNVPTSDHIRDQIRQILNDAYADAKKNRALWEAAPKRYVMLHEFYYNSGVPESVIAAIKQKLDICVPALVNSRSFAEVFKSGTEVVSVDSLDFFYFADTKVYAVPDLLYKLPDGRWVIVDWKTGDEDEAYADQLYTYALYVQNKHHIPADKLLCRLEYLVKGTVEEYPVSRLDLQTTQAAIAESISIMQSCLVDVNSNQPQPLETFPMCSNIRRCPYCNFYELCRPAIEQQAAQAGA
ncbi:MAG TPA: PD-(D/E)XK nuclease family protein [Firmicutes bacterium]|jgi:hypothetical protein|nr:PD-(D/E)XK nuclease family protein [Bacillota bacterium]